MPWPSDPAKRAAALEKHRAAQRARWDRTEERQRARDKALAQFAVPGAREKHAELKRKQYEHDPTIAQRIATALRERRVENDPVPDPVPEVVAPQEEEKPEPVKMSKEERRKMIAERAKAKKRNGVDDV